MDPTDNGGEWTHCIAHGSAAVQLYDSRAALLIFEWVTPSKTGEPPEVRVIGMKLRLMLDRKSCQVQIRSQLSSHTCGLAEGFQKIHMAVTGLYDLDLGPLQPRPEMSARDERGQWGDQNATAAHDSDEPEQNIPGQPHGMIPTEGGFPPLFRGRMVRRIGVVRVDEKIHIWNQHRFTGPARSGRRLARAPVRRRVC